MRNWFPWICLQHEIKSNEVFSWWWRSFHICCKQECICHVMKTIYKANWKCRASCENLWIKSPSPSSSKLFFSFCCRGAWNKVNMNFLHLVKYLLKLKKSSCSTWFLLVLAAFCSLRLEQLCSVGLVAETQGTRYELSTSNYFSDSKRNETQVFTLLWNFTVGKLMFAKGGF